MKHPLHSRGVSLVEALVALAVMAFGMLGLVGLQASMRLNADIAKQRSEAVRIAQERIEQARGFATLTGVSDSFAAIATVSTPQTVTDYTTNTTYTWTSTVAAVSNNPPLISMEVRVLWTDRNGNQADPVVLRTAIAGVSPTLAGSLGVHGAGLTSAFVNGRNPVIPPGAVSQSDGTSRFTPPGSSNVGWVFNNLSGVITQVCDASFSTCTAFNGLLLGGFVRFDLTPPPFNTEVPPSTSFDVGVRVNYTVPSSGGSIDCFTDRQTFWVAYYCAMPVTTGTIKIWSGTPELRGFSVADDAEDDHDDRYRVCRYTPEDSDTPSGGNAAHPRTYTNVNASLANQNYLIIRAGDGSDAYACPSDGPSPLINSNTWDHQPPHG
jgi:type II secretory pathway pseudopilin PulG